jgi:predicted secreted protein
MSLSMAIFTFINAWWILLFAVVPCFVKPAQSKDKNDYAAAPAPVPWKRILVIDTLLALLVTLVLAMVIASGFFPMDTLS